MSTRPGARDCTTSCWWPLPGKRIEYRGQQTAPGFSGGCLLRADRGAPAQRPRSAGWRETQHKGHVFSFSHSFFFLQKKEWEKKEKRHPRSLRFVSQRRLRRNPRRLASQRRLPGGDPTAGGCYPPLREKPAVSCHFSPVLKLVRNLFRTIRFLTGVRTGSE